MSAEKTKIVAHKVTGTVKCYNAGLGFGFITRLDLDTTEDICFHEAALKDNPKKANMAPILNQDGFPSFLCLLLDGSSCILSLVVLLQGASPSHRLA